MSKFDGKAFGEHMLKETQRAMGELLRPLREDITNLKAQVLELREQVAEAKAIRYCGPYQENKAYPAGTFVTYAGSLWHANLNTRERPGEASVSWTLAVKRGRDGKDAR